MIKAKRSTEEYIILTLSGGACVAILPFAFYRVIIADWAVALLDIIAVIGTGILFRYVYKTGKTAFPGKLLACLCLVVVFTTVYLKGSQQILWIYPALTATFFLITPRTAAAISGIFLILLGIVMWPEISLFTTIEFYVSATATLMFSYAFADRMRYQHRQLEQLATKDPLTGAGNRRALEEKLMEMMTHQRRNQDIPASLILMDLDKFKDINDTYGHAIGDEILVEFVLMLEDRIRASDTVFRFGGEEFVVIAENTQLQDATRLAETLRSEVTKNPVLAKYTVTISVGTAQFDKFETAFEWLGRADKAMYQAKDAGRNTCCVAESPLTEKEVVPSS